jgi:DNA-binding CsgD family transcriptional regulator
MPRRRADPTGGNRAGPLTPREREVAHLAGQAYTAAEIGARLHIGERTVETHLANTYMKLGISSRRELIRMASRPRRGKTEDFMVFHEDIVSPGD